LKTSFRKHQTLKWKISMQDLDFEAIIVS